MINEYEKNILLNRLPTFELSYDNIIHKKVFEKIDYYILLPQGIKSILWFTYFKDKYIALIISLNKYNKFENITISPIAFNEDLVYKDTIFLGYQFKIQNKENNFFSITDIIYYKGIYFYNHDYKIKISLFKEIFQNDINQMYLTKNSTIIGLPKIIKSLKNLEIEKNNIIYNLGGIMYIKENYSNNFGISYYNITTPIYVTFRITANIQDDIYNIFIKYNNNYIFYDYLLINSYNTSIFMNNLFRNIKENKNLDLLEESDSENDFENIDEDKYVDLKKYYNIKCKYNNKFKKWIPIEISKDNVITNQELINILKK